MANRKAWNHIGSFTREEAVDLLGDRMVSQKRRVKMREGIRIVYYCNVQRSSGCKYEMSVIVPSDGEAKVTIDDINEHTCEQTPARRRRPRPTVTDLDKPLIKRKAMEGGDIVIPPTCTDISLASLLSHSLAGPSGEVLPSASAMASPVPSASDGLALFINQMNEHQKLMNNCSPSPSCDTWSTVECEIVDFSKIPDGTYTHMFHAKCTNSHYSHAVPLAGATRESILCATKNLCFTFGAPSSLKFDAAYKVLSMESELATFFPCLLIEYHPERTTARGQVVQRREPATLRERVLGWMMERGLQSGWTNHLQQIKYQHNTEYVEDIDSTPLERFFNREIPQSGGRISKPHSENTNTSHDAYSECGTEEAADEHVIASPEISIASTEICPSHTKEVKTEVDVHTPTMVSVEHLPAVTVDFLI